MLVAEANGEIIGYICYGPTPMTDNTWDIYWVVVSSERRKMGIGSKLLKLAEELITNAKGRIVIIETSSTKAYKNTVRFYLNHKYITIGLIPDFYKPGDDKLILEKKLR
ncbi:MAG: GNAT family N-acetyltransferase [Dehalococcoidales bacterium]|nr:GNAT family N-acetyltransferase [Dehalococcoidales bacterium]